MNNAMKVGVMLTTMALPAAGSTDPEPNVCRILASQAERIPAAEWSALIDDPVDTLLHGGVPSGPGRDLSAIEKQLLDDPALHEELGVAPEAALGVERLEGTDVYRIDAFQGTANCQSMIFIEAPAGQSPRRVAAPFKAQPCTPQHGRFGRAGEQPVFLVGGQVAMGELTRSYVISGWKGSAAGWSPACEFTLAFTQRLKLSGHYCSADTQLCAAAASLAPAIVEAYGRRSPIDPLTFAKGRQPPEALMTLLREGSNATQEFPTFGTKTSGTTNPFLTTFSYSRAPMRLALWIDGRWWMGVVGAAGIGWRESTTSLVVISAMSGTGAAPVASFQVEKIPAGPITAHWHGMRAN